MTTSPQRRAIIDASAASIETIHRENSMTGTFRVGLTRDILDSRGEPAFGRAALGILDRATDVEWEYLPKVVPGIDAALAARYDALYVNIARVPAAAVAQTDCRLRVIARHGVGYDAVDVPAMTRAGVIVTNTPSSMPRPVATTALTFVLALAGKLFLKDRLTREGRWHERMDNMGRGLTGRTLGLVGAGRIGMEIMRMARTFDMQLIAADPYANDIELGYVGARKVELPDLMRESDFVIVCCLLDARTRHLIGARELALMRPDAYFINVARGPIVDEAALIDVLARRAIAGAALDVFEREPVDPANPLLTMDHVIVTPHALCWTDECFHNMASTGLKSIVDALAGRRPEFVVNRDVLEHPRVKAWLKA
jgi:phosphoglycerate dehydrogenase-like enzyme